MIRTTKAPFPFSLPWVEGDAVFMLVAGDPIARGELEAELSEHRAARVFEFQMEEAFNAGVAELLKDSPDDVERIREIGAALDEKQEVPPEDRALYSQVQDAVAQHWPPFRALVAQSARRNELLPLLAFARFCTGWQGSDLPQFVRGIDGKIPTSVLEKIDPLLIRLAGMRAYQALWATGDAKNSEQPSQLDASPKPSTGTRRRAGGSATKSGRKTRSSRSTKVSTN